MSEKNITLTNLSELGEFGVIETLTRNNIVKHNSVIRAIGDDAAIIKPSLNNTLITTDLLIEGIHFNLAYCPLKHLGYKAVVVNLSDIYAMNGTPKYITCSIACSNRFPLEALQELYEGIYAACQNYNIDLIGGDTSSSLTGLCISITAIGEAQEGKAVCRNTAKPNDLICVTGDLGAAYMGLQLLERENTIFRSNPQIQPELTGHDYILRRQLKPEARKDVIEILDKIGVIPTAMIDISDGLSSEITHICKQSKVGCEIYEERIPIAQETEKMAQEFNLPEIITAMNGGEDYELLFTIQLKDYEKIKEIQQITIIGKITDAENDLFLVAGEENYIPIVAQGWNAMNKE